MGVKFYKYLKSHKLVKAYQPNPRENDNLFIDGTNIFYFFKSKSGNSFIEVSNAIRLLLPHNLVYISMDGKNPNPKIQNQIERGKIPHTPMWEELDKDELNSKEEWNASSFNELGEEYGVETIYNGRNIDGEAEHKVAKYFRDQKSQGQWEANQKHIIFCNDNDAIFLFLPFIDEDISIIKVKKNKISNQFEYFIIDLKEVRSHFLNMLPPQYSSKSCFNKQNVIIDFVLLSFFLGNDYIQSFKEIDNCPNSFDKIVESYVSLNSKGSRYVYLIYGGTIDKQIFQRFVLTLSSKLDGTQHQAENQHQIKGKGRKQPQHQQQTRYSETQKREARNLFAAYKWTYSYYLNGIQLSIYKTSKFSFINLYDFGKLIEYC